MLTLDSSLQWKTEQSLLQGVNAMNAKGGTAVIVDDGIATGASMLAGVRALRASNPEAIVVAVPVGPQSVCEELAREARAVLVLEPPVRDGTITMKDMADSNPPPTASPWISAMASEFSRARTRPKRKFASSDCRRLVALTSGWPITNASPAPAVA